MVGLMRSSQVKGDRDGVAKYGKITETYWAKT